jgi:hypothetical protein
MDSTQSEIKSEKKSILKIVLWILLPVSILSAAGLGISEVGPVFLPIILAFIGLAILSILFIMAKKYYNWPVIFILIFLLGLFFKGRHWPLAGALLTTGIIFLCLTSLINAIRFQITMRNNPFLRWFGSISCVIVLTYMLGWLFLVQHWSKEMGDILGYTGIVLFVISILGLVFTLPGSNYLGWNTTEKKTFFRSILLPMGIVFSLVLITLVFSDVYFWILDRYGPPLELKNSIEMFDLEGLRKL